MFWGSRYYRFFIALVISLSLCLAPGIPAEASSQFPGIASDSPTPSPAYPLHFNVTSVAAGRSVTVQPVDFPMRTRFTVRMAVAGKQAANGAIIGQLDTGDNPQVNQTYSIPEDLRGKVVLALRFESADHYLATNWFFNEEQPPIPSAAPEVRFQNVKKNVSAGVSAIHLPANTPFDVRVGPYDTFYRNYTSVARLTSTPDGTLETEVQLPKGMQDTERVMVRLDGGGISTSAVFQNIDGGKVIPPINLVPFRWCKVVGVNEIPDLLPREQFDAIWTVQNISNITWDEDLIGYHFLAGEELYKYESYYPIDVHPKDGDTFDIAVDMIAPEQPGWHFTKWSVFRVRDQKEMCTLDLAIFVKPPPQE